MNLSTGHFDRKARDWDSNPLSQERARKVADAIRAAVPLTPSMTALEYGCGTGALSFLLQDTLGPITLKDSSSGMLAVLCEKIAMQGATRMTAQQSDLTAAPLPNEHYDLIYSSMTLHHIPDTERMLGMFYTLLNPGGILCIADLDEEDGSFHDPEMRLNVHHGFSRAALTTMAHRTGFVTVHFSTIFEVIKQQEQGKRAYPIFLMVANRE